MPMQVGKPKADFHYDVSDSPEISERINGLCDLIANLRNKAVEEWLSSIMAKEMPPDIFLKAYGNDECKMTASKWMVDNGYELRYSMPIHGDTIEIWKDKTRIAGLNIETVFTP